MKKLLNTILTAICLTSGTVDAFPSLDLREWDKKISAGMNRVSDNLIEGMAHVLPSSVPILDCPAFLCWEKDITSRIDEVFDNLVPFEERELWKKAVEGTYVGKIGEDAAACWIPSIEAGSNWTEQLSCTFLCKPYHGKRQYFSIDEYFETYKTNVERRGFEPKNWAFKKLSDSQGLLEWDRKGGDWHMIEHVYLLGDWLIVVDYDFKEGRASDWIKKKEQWKNRLLQISFGEER